MTDKSKTAPAGDNVEPLRRTRPCPICDQPSSRKFFPFCSKRCADVDLNRWLTGHYAVPVVEEDGGTSGGEEPY
ncbi:MAG: DNA gyrase inhibitor YacG [Hyphomicrobiales bacterium]|nr:MAG: DNA gyrase inhibitor YacG [Hyphomicrobiales bacterium]